MSIKESEMDLQVKLMLGIHFWHECLGYRCDEVQHMNYRLDKRDTLGHGLENTLGHGLEN